MLLHERIADLRTDIDWSQEKLARKPGLSRSTVATYEQGKNQPSCKTLLQMAGPFDVSLDYLMGRTHDRPSAYRFRRKL